MYLILFDYNMKIEISIVQYLPIPDEGQCSQMFPQPFPISFPQQQSFLDSFIDNGSTHSLFDVSLVKQLPC